MRNAFPDTTFVHTVGEVCSVTINYCAERCSATTVVHNGGEKCLAINCAERTYTLCEKGKRIKTLISVD